jgi:hypothetical protein
MSDWRAQSLMSLPTIVRIGSPMISSGQTLPQPNVPVLKRNLQLIRRPEVPNDIALFKLGALSGWGEPYNMSTTLDAVRIQGAIRAAERGDTWQLFTIFRDMIAGYTHLQNEFAKRKLTVVGQPHAVLPKDKNSAADKKAAKAIEEMIEHCDNWNDALDNMLDSTLWPVSVQEKLFAAVEDSDRDDYEIPIRFRLRKLDPVSPTLFCYKIPYLASGFGGTFASGGAPIWDLSPQTIPLGPNQAYWNPDDWEPELRFYEVFQNGYPNFSPASTYQPEPARHLVHRGTNLSKTIRDNFGGHLRAILFWWFLAISGRDWFGRYMQRWGHPFIVGKVDAQQHDTLVFMQNALSLATEIGGLIIDKEAEATLMQAASLNGAEGYKLFLEVCNDEVSKVVVGQTLSSSSRATGLGSGVAKLHGEVRQDYRQSDMRKLSSTLVKQLFRHFLKINAIKGQVRGIIWGGKDETQAELLARTMKDFSDAGIEADDSGIDTISERVGISLQRISMDKLLQLKGGGGNGFGGGGGKGGRERPKAAQAKQKNLSAEEYEEELEGLERSIKDRETQILGLRNELELLQPLIHSKANGGNGFGARMLKL